MEPRLAEAQRGERAVFFVDAAHLVLGGFLTTLWTLARTWVKAPSGRQRLNILAALNAVTHEIISLSNTTYINAQSVCELLGQIASAGITTAITLVMDNARYQRCKAVQSLAAELGIEILFLPSYSPNLNLIERLWKYVRKECLYGKYYGDFARFSTTIETFLSRVREERREDLQTLLALNFQTFEKCKS